MMDHALGINMKESNRANVEWVDINEILPNPLNPRKNDAVQAEDLIQIIKKRGWEEPVVCYKRGKMYVLLAGHRRLFAARQAKVKQLPAYVVEAPKSHQEEIERIASLQSGRVDWSTFEWASFTFERWIAWGKPGLKKFAKEINLPYRNVEEYVTVLNYFPNEEIETGLKSGSLNVSFLLTLAIWIKQLNAVHHELIETLSEDIIRRTMLNKFLQKKVTRDELRKKKFLETVKTNDLKEFFLNTQMSMEELMTKYEFDVHEKTFSGKIIAVGFAKKNIKTMNPKNQLEAEKAFNHLRELQETLENQLKNIQNKYPDVVKKDNLFDWN